MFPEMWPKALFLKKNVFICDIVPLFINRIFLYMYNNIIFFIVPHISHLIYPFNPIYLLMFFSLFLLTTALQGSLFSPHSIPVLPALTPPSSGHHHTVVCPWVIHICSLANPLKTSSEKFLPPPPPFFPLSNSYA